jgi:signal transduction histidine kinase
MQPPARPAPWLARSISTEFGRRHVKGVAITRLLAAIAAVTLGSIFCVSGHWWGALLFIPAALNGWFAYLMPRWKRALDDLKSGPRVRELERSRALVVDDAAARLRRIEQDLHDGAQAQMVAVVMKLGLARDHLGSAVAESGQGDLERGLELVDAAHRGAMEAITELRNLAHGIHPPALAEGLGAALTALAARSDLPVELVLDLPERASAAIEVIAYFCAAELLTNAAKHSAPGMSRWKRCTSPAWSGCGSATMAPAAPASRPAAAWPGSPTGSRPSMADCTSPARPGAPRSSPSSCPPTPDRTGARECAS